MLLRIELVTQLNILFQVLVKLDFTLKFVIFFLFGQSLQILFTKVLTECQVNVKIVIFF
jgi:hypothetical protein